MSKYDNITTAADLISEVRANGLSTATEDIVRAQDILGRSTVEEIDFLAQGGEINDSGKPKKEYIQKVLFQIVFACLDRERAVALYNKHVTRYPAQLEEAQGKLRQEIQEHNRTKDYLDIESRMHKTAEDERVALKENYTKLLEAHQAAEAEILQLKAKLYDMMTAGA